jgi:hypothetical protein
VCLYARDKALDPSPSMHRIVQAMAGEPSMSHSEASKLVTRSPRQKHRPVMFGAKAAWVPATNDTKVPLLPYTMLLNSYLLRIFKIRHKDVRSSCPSHFSDSGPYLWMTTSRHWRLNGSRRRTNRASGYAQNLTSGEWLSHTGLSTLGVWAMYRRWRDLRLADFMQD